MHQNKTNNNNRKINKLKIRNTIYSTLIKEVDKVDLSFNIDPPTMYSSYNIITN